MTLRLDNYKINNDISIDKKYRAHTQFWYMHAMVSYIYDKMCASKKTLANSD